MIAEWVCSIIKKKVVVVFVCECRKCSCFWWLKWIYICWFYSAVCERRNGTSKCINKFSSYNKKRMPFVHKNTSFTCTSPRETFLSPFNPYFQVGAINIQYLIFSSFHYTSVPIMKAGFEIWLIFLRSGEANCNTHTCIQNRGSAVKDQKQCGELASLFDIGKPGWIFY